MRKYVAVGVVALFTGVAVLFFVSSFNKTQQQSETQPGDYIVQAITRQKPLLTKDDRPVIEVVDVTVVDNSWYVADIKSVNEETASVPVKIVLVDRGSPDRGMDIILGPDVSFSEADMLSHNLPDSVIAELSKS